MENRFSLTWCIMFKKKKRKEDNVLMTLKIYL